MNFNIYNILIITGIVQGFVFTGVVCFSKKFHSKSTLALVALIFSYTISNLIYVLPDIGVISQQDMYAYYFLPIASVIAPIIYFYVILFLNPEKSVSSKSKLLLLPFVIFLILILNFRLPLLFGNIGADIINSSFRFTIVFHELFSIIYSLIILIVTFIHISKYKKKYKVYSIKIIRPEIKWLKITISAILLLTILWGYLAVKNIFFADGTTKFYSLWVAMAALIYWLGHYGIYNYAITIDRKKIRHYNSKLGNTSLHLQTSKNNYITDLEEFLINNKAYLDSTLSLESTAKNLKISKSYLSRIIHSELQTSFTDYLHGFRIEEAKSYLSNPEFSDYTITSIGLEAGFNSRSSFFEIFKKETGKTPLEYKKEHLNK